MKLRLTLIAKGLYLDHWDVDYCPKRGDALHQKFEELEKKVKNWIEENIKN